MQSIWIVRIGGVVTVVVFPKAGREEAPGKNSVAGRDLEIHVCRGLDLVVVWFEEIFGLLVTSVNLLVKSSAANFSVIVVHVEQF